MAEDSIPVENWLKNERVRWEDVQVTEGPDGPTVDDYAGVQYCPKCSNPHDSYDPCFPAA